MTATEHKADKRTVLAVDDETVSLTLLAYFLNKAGYRTITLESAEAARRYIAEHGPEAVHCVVTDYRMPGETGLELLLWLKQQDRSLAVIMITATTEREFVAQTLRGGAMDFLDKPIAEAALLQSVARAVDSTLHGRHLAETERAIRQVGRTQHQLFGLGPEAARWVEVCFHPHHQAGGDFVNFFQLSPMRFVVLTADVSGHDLHAAFVAAYFQGMMRGMLESGQELEAVFAKFNRFLLEEWSRHRTDSSHSATTSLSVCAAIMNIRDHSLTLMNHGAPQPWFVSSDGRIKPCATGVNPPLGWFESLDALACRQSGETGGQLLIWTDGLDDLAADLGVNPLSLASALQTAHAQGKNLSEIARARDDVLAIRISLSAEGDSAGAWMPILYERYPGSRQPPIDAMQLTWERSFQLALPGLSETRRFDVLLALREAMINALLHGCGGNPDLLGELTLLAQPGQRLLRAIVSDPGPGHSFTRKPHEADEELADLHRGLGLIQRLATQLTPSRNGAELTLDFRY